MKQKIALLHFMPIEGYPPVQNILNCMNNFKMLATFCFTTHGKFRTRFQSENKYICRIGSSYVGINKLQLLYTYFIYNLITFLQLVFIKPQVILYYESISCFPAILYKKLFPKVKLLIHYHEYTSKDEYISGSSFVKLLHAWEIKNYHLANKISHTNIDRLKKFCIDYNMKENTNQLIVPNYPPKSWSLIANSIKPSVPPLKMVYLGHSLDNETMYVKEIFDFIIQNSNFTLDIFLFYTPEEYKLYSKKTSGRINFHASLEYKQIPVVLPNYHIGLILYRGKTENYIYNAPNKLFEYLACGLDVWIPKIMVSCQPFLSDTSPKVLMIDYENLNHFRDYNVENRQGNQPHFFCENIYYQYINDIII